MEAHSQNIDQFADEALMFRTSAAWTAVGPLIKPEEDVRDGAVPSFTGERLQLASDWKL